MAQFLQRFVFVLKVFHFNLEDFLKFWCVCQVASSILKDLAGEVFELIQNELLLPLELLGHVDFWNFAFILLTLG